jgi:hypothetical protein
MVLCSSVRKLAVGKYRIWHTHKWCEDYSYEERDNVRPNWKGNILFDDDHKTKNEGKNKDDNIPPPRCLRIMLGHVLMMSIVITPLSCALVRSFDVPAPKEDAVGNQRADLEDTQLITKRATDMY